MQFLLKIYELNTNWNNRRKYKKIITFYFTSCIYLLYPLFGMRRKKLVIIIYQERVIISVKYKLCLFYIYFEKSAEIVNIVGTNFLYSAIIQVICY